jgi:hypothetical protein
MIGVGLLGFSPKDSTAISRVQYNVPEAILSLTFKSGGTHHFKEVPVAHYHALQDAQSAGKYYHAHIRDKYKVAK